MEHLNRRAMGAISALLGLLDISPSPVHADEEIPFSATFTLTSDYRFRGLSQNDRKPAPQAEFDWRLSDSWSVGAFTSAVDLRDHENTSIEVDLFVNRHFDFDETSLDITAFYYAYPDHDRVAGNARYSTFEMVGVASRAFGPITLSGTLAWSPNFFAGSGTATYAGIGVSHELSAWLAISAHAGRQWVRQWAATDDAGYPYNHWDIGATASYRRATLDIRLTGTSLSEPQCALVLGGPHWCGSGLVATISYAI